MFDLAWSEIALIGVVALIAIGPKDMPVAIKAVAEMIKKARRMAGEFQVHVDEMVREANLHEVRDSINDIRSMDIKGKILKAVDGDGSMRKTMSDTPFNTTPPPVNPVLNEAPLPDYGLMDAPAFVPPDLAQSSGTIGHDAPSMIPPAFAASTYIDPRGTPPPASPTPPAPHA